jgi:RHH-type proline utilization regulon transcriptional repressor/proline dehydrogenase/delta 1-pyrroline-5-carboxylate dehydrogenase
VLRAANVALTVEDDEAWTARVARLAGTSPARIRLIGTSVAATARAAGGSPDIAVYASDVVSAGRVELLTFLHEQAVSITAHRYGTPNHLSDAVI